MADWMELGTTLLGGLLGSKAGGDQTKTETQTRDPWAPSQPYLLDNLKTNADLQKYYQQNPFNAQQKTSYNNIFGDLDNFRNNTAPGLMDFANNAMTGSYQRQQYSAPGMAGYSQRPAQQFPSIPQLPAIQPQQQAPQQAQQAVIQPPPQPAQAPWQQYMQSNPDVAAAYAGRANNPDLASTVDMSPQEFAQTHYQKFGQNEQRQWGNPSTPGGSVVDPFSVRTGPDTTYGAVDFEAMNPFSAQNKPTTQTAPTQLLQNMGNQALGGGSLLGNAGMLGGERASSGNGNGGNVGAGNSGDNSFSGFGGLGDAVGGGFGFGSDNTYGIGSEFNGDKALSGVKAGASFGPAGMALGGLFGGLFGGYKSQAEIDAEVADMDQRLSAQDSRRHGSGSGFGNGSGYNSGFGGDSSHGTQGY